MYRFDVDHGGFGLTKDIPPEFLQDTTLEEKYLAAQWVRTALAGLQEKKQESEWRRKRYGGLLLALEADVLSDEEFLRIGRETKSIQEVVTRLLELGRVDEAVQDASQANGWQLVKLADLYVQHEQNGVVERMMYEKAQQEMYTIYAEWLKNHYLAKNNLAAALEMAQLIFHKQARKLGLQIQSWTEAARTVWLVIDVHRRTLDKSNNKEESDAKGNQSVGDVPTKNIYIYSARIAENGSDNESE